jgi:hypothetical protein
MDGSGLRFETMDHVGEYPDTMAQASLFTLPLALGNCLPTITLGQRGPSCSSREAARQQFNFFGTAKARRAIAMTILYPRVCSTDCQSLSG